MKLGGKSQSKEVMLAKINQKVETTPRLLKLVEIYWDLMVNTHYLNDSTYQHVVLGKPYKDIMQESGVKYNTLKNRIKRDLDKVESDITIDLYDFLNRGHFDKKEIESLTKIVEGILENVQWREEKLTVRDKLNFDIDKYTYNPDFEIDDIAFIRNIEQMKPLSIPYIKVLHDIVDTEFMGYVKYLLLTNPKYLTKAEQEKQKEIQTRWLL